MRRLGFIAVCCCAVATSAMAQSPEEQVKAANQAVLAAGLKGDAEGVARLSADDLKWIRSTGALLSKSQFVARITPAIGQSRRTFTEESVAVHGDIAVLVCRSDFVSPQGEPRAERVLAASARPSGGNGVVSWPRSLESNDCSTPTARIAAITRAWTPENGLRKSNGRYEVACHEGNYSLANILSAARGEEKR